jgi:hypothetical protein
MNAPHDDATHDASPLLMPRRRALAALGATALAALLGACASPLPPRPMNASAAPRVGDNWRYGYRSDWNNVQARTIDVSVTAVGSSITDRMSIVGMAGGDARSFGSDIALALRPLGGVVIADFAPYVLAFGAPPQGTFAATMPPPQIGSQWSGTASVGGTEQVAVAAGSFSAVRIQLDGTRGFVGGMDSASDAVSMRLTAWYAPAVKRFVKLDFLTTAAMLNPLSRDHLELLSYKVA